MSEERVLVAGVGNTLHGDDGFGVFAVRELEQCGFPEDVRVVDFGGRSKDLASEIQNGYDAVILLETASQGGEPGTLYVFDPAVDPVEAGQAVFASRAMAPEDALQVLDALDGYKGQIFIVGCEPGSFESVDALSEPVEAALPGAVSLLESLLDKLSDGGGASLDVSPTETAGIPPSEASLSLPATEAAPQPVAA